LAELLCCWLFFSRWLVVIMAQEVAERDLILLQVRRRHFDDGFDRGVFTEPGEEKFYVTSVVDSRFW